MKRKFSILLTVTESEKTNVRFTLWKILSLAWGENNCSAGNISEDIQNAADRKPLKAPHTVEDAQFAQEVYHM